MGELLGAQMAYISLTLIRYGIEERIRIIEEQVACAKNRIAYLRNALELAHHGILVSLSGS